jgi:hypothetical protein
MQADSIVGGCSDGIGDEQNNRGHYGQARADVDRRKLRRQHLRQGNISRNRPGTAKSLLAFRVEAPKMSTGCPPPEHKSTW